MSLFVGATDTPVLDFLSQKLCDSPVNNTTNIPNLTSQRKT